MFNYQLKIVMVANLRKVGFEEKQSDNLSPDTTVFEFLFLKLYFLSSQKALLS